MDQAELALRLDVVTQVQELFPHSKELSDNALQRYIKLTADIPFDDFERCLDEAAAGNDYMPTVKQVRDAYFETNAVRAELALPTADEAWGEVVQQIARVGYVGTPEFSHELTATLVKRMGWRDLCASENPMADRAHFLRMFQASVSRQAKVDRMLPETRRQLEASGQTVRAILPDLSMERSRSQLETSNGTEREPAQIEAVGEKRAEYSKWMGQRDK